MVRGRPPPIPLAGQRGTERESKVNEILEFFRQMLPVWSMTFKHTHSPPAAHGR